MRRTCSLISSLCLFCALLSSLSGSAIGSSDDPRLAGIERNLEDAKAASSKLDKEIRTLKSRESDVLFELTMGLYCSECKQTKTEIESHGEKFEAHLARVKGKAESAPAALRSAKEREFEARIAELTARQKQIGLLADQLQEAARARENEIENIARINKQNEHRRAREARAAEEAARNQRKAEAKALEQQNRAAKDQAQTAKRQAREQAEALSEKQLEEQLQAYKAQADLQADRVEKLKAYVDNELPKNAAAVRAIDEEGKSDATLGQIGGAARATVGATRAANAVLAPNAVQFEVTRRLREVGEGLGDAVADSSKGDFDGGVAGTAKSVSSAAKAADRADQIYKKELRPVDAVAKGISALDKASDGDYVGAATSAVEAGAALKDSKPLKAAAKTVDAVQKARKGEATEAVKKGADAVSELSTPGGVGQRAAEFVAGAADVYAGGKAVIEMQDEKKRIEERAKGNEEMFQKISDRLKTRIKNEEALLRSLREAAGQPVPPEPPQRLP